MKTQIYAPRLVGDIDLGLEPSRIDGYGARQWARQDFPGGRIPGQLAQTIMEQSSDQRYWVGTRRIEYTRTFRYSFANGALASIARMVVNSNYAPGVTGHANEDGYEGVLYAAADAEATSVYLADTNDRAANYYQGGHLIAYSTGHYQQYYIVASDADYATTYVRCYLSEPLVTNILITDQVTAYLSPYSAVSAPQSVAQEYEGFVGLAPIPITDGNYFWLQTRGPCFITPSGDWPGGAVHLRSVYAHMNGTIRKATLSDPSDGYQYVGYLLSVTGGTAGDYGDAFIMLELE